MSLSYTFYIYVNSTTDLNNICTQKKTIKTTYTNYDLNACLFKSLPQANFSKYISGSTSCSKLISPCQNASSTTQSNEATGNSSNCFSPSYNLKTFGQFSIPYDNPPLSDVWPVNSLPGGISTYNNQITSFNLSQILSNNKLAKNQFITFRNSTIKETGSNPTIGFYSTDNGVSKQVTTMGYTYYGFYGGYGYGTVTNTYNFYSKTTCSTSMSTINGYNSINSNTANFFYINNDTSTPVNSLPMKYSGNSNVPYQTQGIGTKYFFPALGTSNPPSTVASGDNINDYPLGTKFVSPYQENSNNINSFVLCQVSAECLGICCPGGSNLLTGIGYYNYTSGFYSVSQAYVPLDLIHFGSPQLSVPVYQLKDPYTSAPIIQNNEYVNPFLNKPRTNSYYSYGIFSNPTVQLLLGEQLPNATEYTPSALFSVTYTIQETELQNPENLYSVMDLLNFYNNLYSYSNSEFLEQKLSKTFSYPVSDKTDNQFGNFISSPPSGTDSPMYTYYQQSCESAKKLVIDYCSQSKNMGNILCSAPMTIDGTLRNLDLAYLGFGDGSPCQNPFTNCQNAWSSYCQNTSNCLNAYCEAYFTNGYVNNAPYLDESIQIELRNVCSNLYENAPMSTPSPGSPSSKVLPENFYSICGCYLPDSVYQKYEDEYYVSGQPLGSNQCWYMPCATSKTPTINTLHLKCPDTAVATCVQQSYLDLKTNGGNIENNNFTVNQTVKKCSTQISFEEGSTPETSTLSNTTMAPTNYNFSLNDVEGGLSGSIKIPIRYYPRGFVLTVLVVFAFLFCLILFG